MIENSIVIRDKADAISTDACCWINGEFVDAENAGVSVFDHGFLYGDGVFEGIRFYGGKAFRLRQHLIRLRQSAAALCLELPYSEEQLYQAVEMLIQHSALSQGYIRMICTRGIGELGINPENCKQPNVILIAAALTMVTEEQRNSGIRAIIAATRRHSADRLDPRIKSLNYLNAIFARIEANYAGVEEAILLNERGGVTEGSVDNLFIAKDGVLMTPPVTEGILAGITRAAILQLAKNQSIPLRETPLTAYDLYTAQECFLTGTGAGLIPVREIDGRTISNCPGEFYQRLGEAYRELIDAEAGK